MRLRCLGLLTVLLVMQSALAATATQATCQEYLATSPSPTDIPAVTGPGVAQRTSFLASGGKLVTIANRYYSVSIPAAFYTAANPIVIFDLHGTGGYPEAEWNDWHTAMEERGVAFIALGWGGGAPGAAPDTEIYQHVKQIFQEVGAACPLSGATKWLMGFSVGSAMSFAVMIRDVADQRLFRGQIAVSGASIGPLTTGREVLHDTVEANRSNTRAVKGTLSWMYCGDKDLDHSWSMCTEMPLGQAFVNEHGGQATLYQDPNGEHHSLPASSVPRNQMFDYLVAAPASSWVNIAQTDCLFNAAEVAFPSLLTPKPAASLTAAPFRYRYYTKTNSAIGVSMDDDRFYYLDSSGILTDLGMAAGFLDQLSCR
ncbi:MAG: hypothetical protein WCV99_10410 [Sterolibacterium sp.]